MADELPVVAWTNDTRRDFCSSSERSNWLTWPATKERAEACSRALTDHATASARIAELEEQNKAMERERDNLRARVDRAVNAAEEHFGEDAVRYKLSLFKNGRASNHFPAHMDGKWFAFQRADDNAHVGLSLRIAELEAECEGLKADLASYMSIANAEAAEAEAMRKDASRWVYVRDNGKALREGEFYQLFLTESAGPSNSCITHIVGRLAEPDRIIDAAMAQQEKPG